MSLCAFTLEEEEEGEGWGPLLGNSTVPLGMPRGKPPAAAPPSLGTPLLSTLCPEPPQEMEGLHPGRWGGTHGRA